MPKKETRASVLYARITEGNKKFIEDMAAKNGVSVSEYLNFFIEKNRRKDASNS